MIPLKKFGGARPPPRAPMGTTPLLQPMLTKNQPNLAGNTVSTFETFLIINTSMTTKARAERENFSNFGKIRENGVL